MEKKKPIMAMVPGGTGGIGREVVKMFLKNGTEVVVPTRGLKDDYSSVDEEAIVVKNNYYEDEDVKSLARTYDKVDTFVYCVGSFRGHKKISDFTYEDIDDKFKTNIRSFWNFLRHFVPLMREKGYGNVIAIGSLAAKRKEPYLGLSSWAKDGLASIIETLSNEESVNGIRANIIVPSIVDTAKERLIFPQDNQAYWLPASYIEELVEFLCYDARSRYLNGNRLECYVPNKKIVRAREENLINRGVNI